MRRPRSGLVLRALWWRRGVTLAVLIVAIVTTTAAALGPLYARAAGESILQDHLTQAGYTAGLHLHGDLELSPAAYTREAAAVPKPGTVRGYQRQIRGLYTPRGVNLLAAGSQLNVAGALAWRDGACQHLVLVSGRCPTAAGQTMVSQRTAASKFYGFHLGGRVEVDFPSFDGLPVPSALTLTVVGIYRPIDTTDPFWFGQSLFDAHSAADPNPDTIDSLFVSRGQFDLIHPAPLVEADFDYPVTPSAIRLQNATTERSSLSHLLARYRGEKVITANSSVLSVLSAAARERHAADVSTQLVTWQLALLAFLVLFQIVSDAIEARGNEIAMAKLRGLSPGATARFGLAEPIFLLAVAVPLGVLAALGVAHLFAAAALVSGVPVVLPLSAIYTALIAFAGGIGATALAGYRTLTRSVMDQWRRTDRGHANGRLILILDVLLAIAAVVGLVALRNGHDSSKPAGAGSTSTFTLLAPGLLIAAVGLLGVRLLPLVCRWLARLTRGSRRLGLFLAARQVARRPVGLRLAALLAVAVGLATFAVAGETVALNNRSARAQAELGAHRVASVQLEPGADPVAITHRLDPQGKWAMAAATWLPFGGDTVGTVLGVDSSRLDAVGDSAAGGPSTSAIASILGRSAVPPITITAPRLRVHLVASDLTGDRRPYLEVNLRTPRARVYNADSSTIRAGAQTIVVPLKCASGCSLVGLTWNRQVDAATAESGTIRVTGIDIAHGSGWTPLDLGTHIPGAWRAAVPEGQASDRVTVTPVDPSTGSGGIEDRFGNQNGGYAGIAYASNPSPIPAVATPKSFNPPSVHRRMIDTTATTAYFSVLRSAPVLPVVLNDGLIMDVRYLSTELPGFTGEAQWQVWLGPAAPADALARLTAAGLPVEHVRTEQARLHQLGRQGPALALLLLLVCAIAGTALAVGGTAISISASSRRRSYEIAALRVVGISRRALLRAGAIEQLLLLGAAALLGVPTGLVAAAVAMPVIPEFADRTPITLDYTPSWTPTLLFALAFIVLLTLTAVIGARGLIRAAIPSRLREAEG